MKKLVVLILFMFMASVATAAIGLDILVNGGASTGDVYAGDTVTLNFTDTAAATFAGISAVEIDVDWGDFTSYALGNVGGTVFMNTLASVGAGDGFGITGSVSGFMMYVPTGGIVFTVIFDVPSDITASEVAIDLAGAINLQLVDSFSTTLNVIPEPMTMALLGLGGLFLRRKK